MNKELKRVTVSLTAQQHEGLERLAFQRRTSMSKLLRNAAVEILEDEEDVREGLKSLADEKGTVSWEQYQKTRLKRRRGV